jgi:hypothetical protein
VVCCVGEPWLGGVVMSGGLCAVGGGGGEPWRAGLARYGGLCAVGGGGGEHSYFNTNT